MPVHAPATKQKSASRSVEQKNILPRRAMSPNSQSLAPPSFDWTAIPRSPPGTPAPSSGVIQLHPEIIGHFGKDPEELSRHQLNQVIDGRVGNFSSGARLAAEREQRRRQDVDHQRAQKARQLILDGKHDEALKHLRPNIRSNAPFKLKSTTDYSQVVPENEPIPPGTAYGVTVPDDDGGPSTIHIHRDHMDEWAKNDQMGNLVNTIEHEAVHAGQHAANRFPNSMDAKEFEAYSTEVLNTHQRLVEDQKHDLPTADQIKKAYADANEHWESLGQPEQQQLQGQKDRMEQLYRTHVNGPNGGRDRLNVVTPLEMNDERTGTAEQRRKALTSHATELIQTAQKHKQARQISDSSERNEAMKEHEKKADELHHKMMKVHSQLPESDQRKLSELFDKADEENRNINHNRSF